MAIIDSQLNERPLDSQLVPRDLQRDLPRDLPRELPRDLPRELQRELDFDSDILEKPFPRCQDNQEINLGQQSFSSTGSPSVSNKLGEDLSLLDPKLGDIITRIRNEENSGTKQIYPHSGRMAILDELIEFFDGAKDNLFIAEKRNSDIQRVTMSDNTVAFALQERMFFDEDPKIQLAAASAFNHFRLNSAIKGILFDGVMHHENPEVAIECINVIDSLSLSRGYAQTLKLYGQELFTKLVTETKRFPNVIRRAKLTLEDWKS